MYKLVKILSGRGNEAESRTVAVTALSAAIAAGTPVNIAAGVVTPLTVSTTVLATHIVERDAASGATSIFVTDLLPGMVFEAPLTAAIGSMKVGGEYKIASSGVSATAVANSVRGAILFDPAGAALTGDKVLVTFPLA
ncbi:MAG: hypothetical protein IKP55_03675 [Clostridia bacterium]|nr:hypothetical protein [Clostridia bacterium]